MTTLGEQVTTQGACPVGDHRRLHDLLLELRQRADEPSLRKINGTAGVSVGHLSEIFAGKTAPGADVAVRIAQALRATDREQARVRFYAEGVEADRSARRARDGRRAHRAGWEGCPYLGLPAFEERHARIFYGRRALTEHLVRRLREHPHDAGVLLVLGPSGSGKSSLLRAGLMGSLAEDALAPGCGSWPRRVITPTGDPLRQLAIHLADLAGTEAVSVHEALLANPGAAHLLAGQALAAGGLPDDDARRLVLVVDQLEELFTLTCDAGEQQRFLAALYSMATAPVRPGGAPAALVIAGIRGDFLDQALAFPPVRQSAEAGVFAVGAMTESELREAVAGPAAEAGVRVPENVCVAILDDLRERSLPVGFDSGALPLLSQVMFVMWQAEAAAGLTLAGYHRTGGVADIVRTSAERVYESLDPGLQELTRRVFLQLTTVTDGKLTRRPGTRGALRAAACSDDVALVVEAFAAHRLLTVADNDLVTIAHEELMRSWTRLHDWLRPSLTDQALHRALADDVQTWQGRGRDPSYLYHGGRLLAVADAVGRWADDPAGQLPVDPTAAEFLQASHRRARRRRRAYQAVTAVMVVLFAVTGTTAVLAHRSAVRADLQHAIALSRQLAAISGTTSGTDRGASEQLAAAALAAGVTDESLGAASALLADASSVLPGDNGIVSLSADGRRLATVTAADNTVWLWDPATGRRVGAPLVLRTGPVKAAALSPDGTRLATLPLGDNTVHLWDPATGRPVGVPLTGHSGPINGLDFSPDSRLLVTVGMDGTVRRWDPATGRPIGAPSTGHTGPVKSVRFSLSGKYMATADDKTIRVWDPATGRPVGAPAPISPGPLYGINFSPDEKLFATADGDNTAQLWDAATGHPVGAPLTGHTGPVYAVVFSPDSTRLATAGDDATVRLWDRATRRPIGPPLTGHTGPVRSMRFSPDGKRLATASDDATVRLWDPSTGRPAGPPLTGHTGPVVAVRYSKDGKLLVTASKDSTVRLWDPATGRPLGGPLTGHTGPVNAVAYSPDGRRLATASTDDTVRLWDPATRRPVGSPLPGHTGPVRAGAFSPDGKLLASAGDDGTVRLWDPATGRPIGVGRAGPVWSVAFRPDGKVLATGGSDGRVQLWDPATARPVGTALAGHAGPVRAVRFSPDGTRLATAGSDGTVRLWDPATGRPVGTPLTGHTGTVCALAFRPDGKLLASAGEDKTVRLWDPETGHRVGEPLTGHAGPVWAAAFSPDGKLLATASDDRTVRLWDPETGHPAGAPLAGHDQPVYGLAFSPDGKTLATASGDTTARLWDHAAYLRPLAALCDRAGGLPEAKWRRYAAHEPPINVCGY
ncbi:AAA family ATPase [Actinoplanes sp. NPDC051343]|uniref:nSTAND1 domain-containing NTPase n=1 Tax=Actinoplanes sp. NPDC051343 TaxID=3363906 RepID=UPI00378A2EF4